MLRTVLTAGAATLALVVAVPAMAQPGPGGQAGGGGAMGGGPSQTGMDARMGAMGPSNASPTAIDHASPNSVLNQGTTTMQPTTNPATGTSQGPYHASPNGAAHANGHSVLSGTVGTPLTNVATGTAVYDTTGTQLGTVSRVNTSNSGTISRVFVTVNGKTYALSPSAFTIDANGNLTTTYTFGG